jgi:hypothetical protein
MQSTMRRLVSGAWQYGISACALGIDQDVKKKKKKKKKILKKK